MQDPVAEGGDLDAGQFGVLGESDELRRPFKWKFTTNDLADFLTRLDNHQPDHQTAQPRAA